MVFNSEKHNVSELLKEDIKQLWRLEACLITWYLAGWKYFLLCPDSYVCYGYLAGPFYVVLADSSNEACKFKRLLAIS